MEVQSQFKSSLFGSREDQELRQSVAGLMKVDRQRANGWIDREWKEGLRGGVFPVTRYSYHLPFTSLYSFLIW